MFLSIRSEAESRCSSPLIGTRRGKVHGRGSIGNPAFLKQPYTQNKEAKDG